LLSIFRDLDLPPFHLAKSLAEEIPDQRIIVYDEDFSRNHSLPAPFSYHFEVPNGLLFAE
jgi:hypothetical protein